MELRHLRAFTAVARTLNVTRAAAELNYAQSSVTEQLQALERELGVALFDRAERRLTPAGEALAGYADRILTLVDEATTAVAAPEPAGDLAVGALETLCAYRLPAVLSRYRTRYPGVRLTVGQGTRGELYQAVRRGELDLCLTFSRPAGLASETLTEMPLVVVVPATHRLAAAGSVGLADLSDEPLLATPPGCGFREMYDAAFPGVAPRAEVSSMAALVACVAAGMGSALLPEVAVTDAVRAGRVAALPVADRPLSAPLAVSWLAGRAARPGVQALRELLREELVPPGVLS